MSDQESEASASTELAGEEDSEFESWLRVAARQPEEARRVALPREGQVIGGKYRIDAELGKGGMGAVYRATHTVSGKQVALKWMLRPASDERARQRFTREARAAGRIDHPNVVDVYDLGEEGEAGYLVMELLHGESLRALLARGRMPVQGAIDLLLPALRGVAAAHRQGVIHRDLKPDNVFLCRGPEGEAREAKVLDFGISAISAQDHDSQTTLTKDGMVLGTPMYMSPEQLESSKDVDARTDVYALGVILYEALTGSLPFSGDSYAALVLAIANTQPKAPRALCGAIPEALERVVLHAMHKDKAQRIQSVDALIAALLPFASVPSAGSGEHLSRELAAVPIGRPASTRRWLWAAVAAVAVAGLSWWISRADAPATEGAAVGTEPAAHAAAAVEAPVAPPRPASARAAVPEAVPAPEPAALAAPGAEAAAPVSPRRTVTDAPRARPRRPATPEATPVERPPAVTPSPRAGRIAVDDL